MHVRFVAEFGQPLEVVPDLSLAPVLFQSLYLYRIWSVIANGPIDGDQLSMRNRDDCTLTPAAEFDSLITLQEKRVLLACRRPARLCQHASQPPVALSSFPASTFSRTFVISRTDRRPRCQMVTVGKWAFRPHVH